MLGKSGLDLRPRFHALKFDFDWRLHDPEPPLAEKGYLSPFEYF
jgi:hypothetical protein